MCIPFFSIVIPIYNVEKYLNECVDSVLAQSFKDFEIILVDDGSPDNCPSICDDYVTIDSRVKVIHKKNGGLSDARNAGVKESQGRYLMFLDSDDYWDDSEALAKLYVKLNEQGKNTDIAIFQAKLLYPDGSMIADSGCFDIDFNTMTAENALLYMSERGLFIGSACSKVIKRSFFLDNNLFFKVGIKSEDIDWVIRVANCMPEYIYTNQYFYIYRKGRSESITANVDAKYLNQFADMLEEFAYNFNYSNEVACVCLKSFVAYEYSILLAKSANLADKDAKKKLMKRIKNMRNIFSFDMHPKVKSINKVMKFIGFDLTVLFLGVYLKYRKR